MLQPILGILMTALAAAPAPGGHDDPSAIRADAIRRFRGRTPAVQKSLLEAARAAAAGVEDPFLASVRAAAERARTAKPSGPAPKFAIQNKLAPEGSFPLGEEIAFPLRSEYVFGLRQIRPVDQKKAAPGAFGPNDPVPGTTSEEFAALLDGMPPDLDLALAQCMRELDTDHGGNALGLFLESWRNGAESFYRALDRTAGTPEEVFYYDAMLGEFARRFAIGPSVASMQAKKGLQQAHDALHDGFLAYRQYRAMREAVALSLLLPPDAPLPKSLRRYGEAPAGQLSLRDEVEMVAGATHESFAAVVDLVRGSAKPLPSPMWAEPYEALVPFHAAFGKRSSEWLTEGLTAEQVIARRRDARREAPRKIAAAVRAALAEHHFPIAEPKNGR